MKILMMRKSQRKNLTLSNSRGLTHLMVVAI